MDFVGKFLDKILGKHKHYDDAVDRLHYRYTDAVVAILSAAIGGFQYAGSPIKCWLPAQFPGYWKQYVENYCFVENTYFVPMEEEVPGEDELYKRDEREIQYYQWVPFVLALQALLFFIPHLLWQMLHWQSGLNVKSIVAMASDAKLDNHEASVKNVAKHINYALANQRDYGGSKSGLNCIASCGKTTGAYVSVIYLLIKVLFIGNVVGQFFLLNQFLGPNYSWWGIDMLVDLANGVQWESSGHFPRVTLCDVPIRVVGNRQRWTLQCVLWINMFNEKVFIFLWWWFFLVAIISCLNLIYWLLVSLIPYYRRGYVSRYLRSKRLLTSASDNDLFVRFVADRLRPDGVFLLRLISANCGELLTTDVIAELWGLYTRSRNPTGSSETNAASRDGADLSPGPPTESVSPSEQNSPSLYARIIEPRKTALELDLPKE